MLPMIRIVVLVLCFVNVYTKEQLSELPKVDHIFESLSNQQWNSDEETCRNKILRVLENVKNSTLWATWVWNSIDESPTGIFFGARYQLGSYDQCLRPPWLTTHPELRTQYCLAEIEMNKDGVKTMTPVSDPYARAEDYYVNSQTMIGRSFSYIAHGVCLPAGCPYKSAEKFVKALLSTGYLRAARDAAVSIHHCEQAGASKEYSTGFYVFIYTFATLFFMALACTYYINQYPVTDNSIVNSVAKSFCIRRNWDILVMESNADIPCLDGIRFLSSAIIPFMHLILMMTAMSATNGLDMELITLHQLKGYFLVHGEILTDTFLAMSGLLLGKSLTKMDTTTPYTMLKRILLRYLRLFGLLAASVFYMAHVSMHTDDGPIYPKAALLEQLACEKNWWLTLLMVGNFFNIEEMCFPGTWYIACDFQLYVMTLFLFFLYRKRPRVGKAVAAIVLTGGFLAPAIATYMHNLPGLPIYNVGLEINGRSNKFFQHLYIPPYTRMGPYVAGLAVGYLMSIYKPKDYKKVWSKTTSFLGVCIAVSLMLLVFAVGLLTFRYNIQGVLTCVFAALDRITFGIGVLGVIVFCTYGDVPLINSFLSWSMFTTLSRLSYGVYLIHQIILYRSKVSLRSNMKIQLFDLFTESLGLTVVSLGLSLAMRLLVEAPLSNITLYLRTSRNYGNGLHRDEKTNNKQKLK